jgi:hypothetical protein
MPQHLAEPGVFAQTVEIIQTIPTQRLQHQKALHVRRFVKSALPLLHSQMALRTLRYTEGPHRPDEQRNAGVPREHFLSPFPVILQQQFPFGGRALRLLR